MRLLINNLISLLGLLSALSYIARHPWNEATYWALIALLWIVSGAIKDNFTGKGGAK